jgi:hypothetical protein
MKGLWLLTIVHCLDELDGRSELHPPVLIFTTEPIAVKRVDILKEVIAVIK